MNRKAWLPPVVISVIVASVVVAGILLKNLKKTESTTMPQEPQIEEKNEEPEEPPAEKQEQQRPKRSRNINPNFLQTNDITRNGLPKREEIVSQIKNQLNEYRNLSPEQKEQIRMQAAIGFQMIGALQNGISMRIGALPDEQKNRVLGIVTQASTMLEDISSDMASEFSPDEDQIFGEALRSYKNLTDGIADAITNGPPQQQIPQNNFNNFQRNGFRQNQGMNNSGGPQVWQYQQPQ